MQLDISITRINLKENLTEDFVKIKSANFVNLILFYKFLRYRV